MGFFSDLADLGKDIGKEFSNLGKELKTIGAETVEEIKSDPAKYAFDSVKEIAVISGKAAKFAVTDVIPGMVESAHKTVLSKANEQLERNDISADERVKIENIKEKATNGLEKIELNKL